MGDLAIGTALGRETHDPQLAGSERFHTGSPLTSWAGASGLELLARPAGQPARAAADGELERFSERLTRSGALARAA